jgi:hypothetical protein
MGSPSPQYGFMNQGLGRILINWARFDARESGDQVFRLDPQEAARLSRIKPEKMARIVRASGGLWE